MAAQGHVVRAAGEQWGLFGEAVPPPPSAHACCLSDTSEFFRITITDFAAGTDTVRVRRTESRVS
jgi:hypothetical protein